MMAFLRPRKQQEARTSVDEASESSSQVLLAYSCILACTSQCGCRFSLGTVVVSANIFGSEIIAFFPLRLAF
jgi:hypothetical protein